MDVWGGLPLSIAVAVASTTCVSLAGAFAIYGSSTTDRLDATLFDVLAVQQMAQVLWLEQQACGDSDLPRLRQLIVNTARAHHVTVTGVSVDAMQTVHVELVPEGPGFDSFEMSVNLGETTRTQLTDEDPCL